MGVVKPHNYFTIGYIASLQLQNEDPSNLQWIISNLIVFDPLINRREFGVWDEYEFLVALESRKKFC